MGSAARAQRRPTPAPVAGVCAKCKSAPSTRACTWELHKKDSEGRRVRAGGKCDVHLCEGCAVRIGEASSLCPWHSRIAKEEGLIK